MSVSLCMYHMILLLLFCSFSIVTAPPDHTESQTCFQEQIAQIFSVYILLQNNILLKCNVSACGFLNNRVESLFSDGPV